MVFAIFFYIYIARFLYFERIIYEMFTSVKFKKLFEAEKTTPIT